MPDLQWVGSETILLVEDEDSVRRFTRLLLERHGCRVVEAASPDQALSTAADFDGPIALLLTDVVMPHLSGPELAEKLRASRPDLRVLYMSGYPAGHGDAGVDDRSERPADSKAFHQGGFAQADQRGAEGIS